MGNLFRKQIVKVELPTDDERLSNAIEYIRGLEKKEFDRFMQAIGHIWEGYDILYRVKTREEKQAIKEAKEDSTFNYELN